MSGESPKRHCFHNFVKIRTTFSLPNNIHVYLIYIYISFALSLLSFVFLFVLLFSSDVLFRMPVFVFWFILLVTNFIIVFVCLDLLTLFDGLLNNIIYIYIYSVCFSKIVVYALFIFKKFFILFYKCDPILRSISFIVGFPDMFVKLVARHDELFLFGATRSNHTRKVRSQCEVAKLLAYFTSPLADDLPFSPFFGMERFCPPPDSLQSAT